jgi:uncharacterized sulfatase
MKRREFLEVAGTGAASALLAGCTGQTARKVSRSVDRPNILWLISEDTSPDLACYGNRLIRTPNLDALAAEGARFTNAFVTAPVCSASRSAFMTGMYQTSIGAHHHRSHREDGYKLPNPVNVITQYFRSAGYFTCNCAGLTYKKPGKTDWNFEPRFRPFDGTDWSQRRPGQPFFAQMNFSLTHRPFQRDPKHPIDPDDVELPPYYPDHPVARRDWADYLESLQVLDTEIGVALRWLEKERLADNTIVMYFGDHGRPHVRGKQWLYEGGIRIPMIVRWPAQLPPGIVVDDLISSIDFAPTFLSWAGIQVPDHLQGHITFGRDAEERRRYIFAARDRCDETVDRIRCIRSGRYKYIRNFMPERPYTQINRYKECEYPVLRLMRRLYKEGKLTPEQAEFMAPRRPVEELYDLKEDPHELVNLAGRQRYERKRKHLSEKLDEWIEATGDKGQRPEDPRIAMAYEEKMKVRYDECIRAHYIKEGMQLPEWLS